ncbi:MAG: hypothetical protein ACFFDO_05330 [Candidatus Thorarchaeota archaeon]
MNKIRNVLFICYANTCRSPGAEYLACYYAKKYNLTNVLFSSAGWHDAFDHAQPETIDYIKDKGINMSDFRPSIITKELIEKADLIIGMERYHLTKLRKKFKDIKDTLKDKMYTLKQFNGANDFNIPDPYMTGLENYNRILKIVDENVELLIKKIIKINKSTL